MNIWKARPELVDLIVSEFLRGVAPRDIGLRLGLTKSQVNSKLDRLGIQRRKVDLRAPEAARRRAENPEEHLRRLRRLAEYDPLFRAVLSGREPEARHV